MPKRITLNPLVLAPKHEVLFLLRSFWKAFSFTNPKKSQISHLGASWALLEASGTLPATPGHSWALLEASGPLLASSGHSWALLEASWKAPVLDRAQNKPNFLSKIFSGGHFWSLGGFRVWGLTHPKLRFGLSFWSFWKAPSLIEFKMSQIYYRKCFLGAFLEDPSKIEVWTLILELLECSVFDWVNFEFETCCLLPSKNHRLNL